MVISAVSFSDVSEIAIVPESEWRTPTLIGPVSAACAFEMGSWPAIASAPDMEPNFRRLRRFIVFPLADLFVLKRLSGGFFISLTESQWGRHCQGYANWVFLLMVGGFDGGAGRWGNGGADANAFNWCNG